MGEDEPGGTADREGVSARTDSLSLSLAASRAAAMKEVRVFDGEEWRISQLMLRDSRVRQHDAPPLAATTAGMAMRAGALGLAAAALRSESVRGALASLLRAAGACAAVGFGIAGLGCAGLYAYHRLASRERSNRLVASYMPVAMRGLDRNMREVRAELLKNVSGKVLDLGAGSGTYFQYVAGRPRVTEYVALEPLEELHPLIRSSVAEHAHGFETRIVGGFVEDLVAAEGGTYDAVILGNVLCEVPEPIADTLAYVCRLLKKGGRVYFSEHVYDREHLWRAALQLLVHPWWVTVSGGCHCNRCQLEAIEACFGRENVCSWTLYAGSVPWTRRYAAEGGATGGCRGASLARFSERD